MGARIEGCMTIAEIGTCLHATTKVLFCIIDIEQVTSIGCVEHFVVTAANIETADFCQSLIPLNVVCYYNSENRLFTAIIFKWGKVGQQFFYCAGTFEGYRYNMSAYPIIFHVRTTLGV